MRWRALPRISAQVSSIVGHELYPVLVTLIPRCCAAATSIDALSAPVEAISFSCGSRSMIARGSGVLSRMTQTTSNGSSLSTSAPGSAIWSLKTVISARSVRTDQSAIFKATF
jgi:hypothetical protein